jgi:hypothetical protein
LITISLAAGLSGWSAYRSPVVAWLPNCRIPDLRRLLSRTHGRIRRFFGRLRAGVRGYFVEIITDDDAQDRVDEQQDILPVQIVRQTINKGKGYLTKIKTDDDH